MGADGSEDKRVPPFALSLGAPVKVAGGLLPSKAE